MENLFGVDEPKKPEAKAVEFEFKSTKGSTIKISYKPSGDVRVTDKKAFEGHLKKVADSFEIVEKSDKPKPIDAVLEAKDEGGDEA